MIRSPFKFLDPFGPNDSKVFFGRSAEIDELYALVFRTPLLLVYGLTGTGKTSLIDCGLRNRFDGTDWLPFYVRRKDNLNDSLREMLRNALPDDKPRDLPETVSYLYRYFLRPVYLIFDQFEELFILGTPEEQAEFKQNLKKLIDANLTCKIILIMREEYIGWLYDFEREIPAIFDFRLRVETMKRKNVEDVIEKSCAAFNIALEAPQDNIRQIYDNVSEGKAVVQLPYLQVYLDTLYRTDVQRTYPAGALPTDEQPYPPLTFTGKEIAECGHISGVLEGFLREKVTELQESMAKKYPGLPADAVKTVLNSFVTPQGTKKPMPYELIDDRIRLLFPPDILRDFNAAFIHDTVRNLEQNRVLRDSGETFELAHDTLAHKIFENRSEEDKRREEVQARLLTAFKEYQESGTYLNAPQIARLEEWLPLLRLSPAEADFVAASRAAVEAQRNKEREEAEKERRLRLEAERAKKRAQVFTYIASAVAVAAVIAGIFAFEQQQRAIANEREAEAQKRRTDAVLDKIYFYDGKFGLAYDKSSQKYGYIDKELNTKIAFNYDEAFSFEYTGYARVKREDEYNIDTYFLIDTLGNEYKLATELNQLDRTITALDLRSKNLETIPAEVYQHQQLAVLILSQNQISNLPDSIGVLKNLQSLFLDGNQLYSLPAEIGQLKQLQDLDLSNNALDSLPAEIGQLQQLQSLDLSYNPLAKLPSEIWQLKHLQHLDLSFNPLDSLPAEIGELEQLQSLTLFVNGLTGLPSEIGQLKQLQNLDLSNNALTRLPAVLGQLKQLQNLNLRVNKLTSLPAEIWQLEQLQDLDLSNNALTSLPAEIGQLKQLQYLDLNNNQLTSLPAEIGQLQELQYLDLNNNQLTNLPAELGQLKQLQFLYLFKNRLTSLPAEIGQLKQLQDLYLNDNKLTSLPAEIGQLKQLQNLDLSNNALTRLPAELGQLKQLNSLVLYKNRLTNLPVEIGQLQQLQSLSFVGNELTSLPAEIWQLKQLQDLNLSNNPLKSLPAGIGQLKQVQSLSLRYIQLTSLPAEIGQLRQLTKLDLRGNQVPKPEIKSLQRRMPWCEIEFTPPPTADELFEAERYKEALLAAQEAFARDSTEAEIYYPLSYYALYAGEYPKAIEYAQKALQLDPEAVAEERYLALGYLLNGQYGQAEVIYKKWKGRKFAERDKNTADATFLRVIARLEAAGITHPDFEKVRQLFGE